MNNIFKQKEVINLTDNCTLTTDGFNGVTLTFSEIRERKTKTEEKEQYTYEDKYYYPSVHLALEKFVTVSNNAPSKEITEILNNVKQTLEVVKEFKENFKNWRE